MLRKVAQRITKTNNYKIEMSKVITFGEIMLRLATPDFLRFAQATEFEASYAGGEANVAVSLANYGIATSFVSAVPKNDIGEAAVSTLKAMSVGTSDIVRSGDRV